MKYLLIQFLVKTGCTAFNVNSNMSYLYRPFQKFCTRGFWFRFFFFEKKKYFRARDFLAEMRQYEIFDLNSRQ